MSQSQVDNTQDTWTLDDTATLSQRLSEDDTVPVFEERGEGGENDGDEPDDAVDDAGEAEEAEEPTQAFVIPDDEDGEGNTKEGGDADAKAPKEIVIKRPQTAYFLFVAAVRDEVKAAHPGDTPLVKINMMYL